MEEVLEQRERYPLPSCLSLSASLIPDMASV